MSAASHRGSSSSSVTQPATHDDGGVGDGSDGSLGVLGEGADTFRQVPINALMDHNDDVRRVCEDFTHALKCVSVWVRIRSIECLVRAASRRRGRESVLCVQRLTTLSITHATLSSPRVHAVEEERLSAGIFRALQSAGGNSRGASASDPSSHQPPPQQPPPSAAPGAEKSEMPSIDVALLAFRCVEGGDRDRGRLNRS